MRTDFRAQPKDFGAEFLALNTGPVTATASATANFGLGAISDKDDTVGVRLGWVEELVLASITAAAGGAAITAQVKKYDASAGAAVNLTATYDLTAITANKADRIAITASDSDRVVEAGDFLYVAIVAAGTVTTNLSGANLTALVKLLK